MKALFTILFALSIQLLPAQQTFVLGGGATQGKNSVINQGTAIGEQVPDIQFGGLLNAPKKATSLNELKGKIVILEFWATWCVPCIPAMDHLKTLKDKFPNDLEVISILYDKPDRLERYIKNKPSSLWHIADPGNSFHQYFPHRSVPHTVIIDQSGKVVAITLPEHVTEKAIADLVSRQSIQLPQKEDRIGENFDPSKEYFPKDENAGYSFDVNPPLPGGFAMTKRRISGPWKDRRLTLINSPLMVIYRSIFDLGSPRFLYEGVDKDEMLNSRDNAFCLDVTVPKGKENELFSYAQAQVAGLDFPVRARLEKRKVMTAVLICTDPKKLQKTKEAAMITTPGFNVMRITEFKKSGVMLDEFAKSYLESFGLLGMPVVNETGLAGLYDFDISLDIEDKESLRNALASIGLKITREEREIDMVVLFKE